MKPLKLGAKIPSLHVGNDRYILEIEYINFETYGKLLKAFGGGGTHSGFEDFLL
jgi:hypothetical protein